MIHSFLLIGQSNAAGRGFSSDVDAIDNCDKRIKVLRNGRWWPAYRPINPDRVTSGVCLAESFAREYATAHPELEGVGIIPCADGGTCLNQWMPGEVLFDNAVNNSRLAMRTSVIKGILWHQGESDCSDEKCAAYEEKFKVIMNALREELGNTDVPIIVGGLGDFLADFDSENIQRNYKKVNEKLKRLGNEYRNCAFASAEGLGANPDNLHFSAKALLDFGERYYEAFKPYDKMVDGEGKDLSIDAPKSAIELL